MGYNFLMTKFYTRSGDDGTTGLIGNKRVPKYHPIPETVGVLDEVMASLGLARAQCRTEQSTVILLQVQRDLGQIMTEISASPDQAAQFRKIGADRVAWLESQTDQITELVEMPFRFILPGDTLAGASLDMARTIIRRAERMAARLYHEGLLENQELLRYMNRLSSLCFVLELFENAAGGKKTPTLADNV